MKKCLTTLLGISLLLLLAGTVNATTITTTFDEYSSPRHEIGEYNDIYKVGDFTFDLMGEDVISATISGTWGNSVVPNTAPNRLYIDDLEIADTNDYTPSPIYNSLVSWTYDFTDFSVLEDGFVDFFTLQLAHYYVRLGETTLTIETAPAGFSSTPEPSTVLLLGFGIVGLTGLTRKKLGK